MCKKNGKRFDPHSLSLTINRTAQAHYLAWKNKAPPKHPCPPPSTARCHRVRFDAAIRMDSSSIAVMVLNPSNKIIWMATKILRPCSPLKAEADAALLAIETVLLLEISEVILGGDSSTVVEDLSFPLIGPLRPPSNGHVNS